jgi:cytochrome c oxidase subunit 2
MLLDHPLARAYTFQDSATPIAEGIIDLHHEIFFYLVLILLPVSWMLFRICQRSCYFWTYPELKSMIYAKAYLKLNSFTHGAALEIIWTIIPSLILMMIALPSFALLYSIDEVIDPACTIKVIGHQWYRSYEVGDTLNSDSYMLPITDLNSGELRLLEVDNYLVLPINIHVRFLVTSQDVLHSFAIPSFGIKVDAVPGRLNQLSTFINREGIYYGQCSELCGANHGFMPIKIAAIDPFIYNFKRN